MAASEDGATLYLRGLPRTVVRESKARAARRGITLTAYVAEILVRARLPWKTTSQLTRVRGWKPT